MQIKMWSAAALAAAVVAGCGSGSSAGTGPVSVAKQWYAALATRNGHKICELSTPERNTAMIELTAQLVKGTSCVASANRLLQIIPAKRLAEFGRARPTLTKQSGDTAEVAKGPGGGWVKLRRSGSKWLVASTSEEGTS